jgi:carbamoyl-phosphate synthase large subunit
MTHKKIRVAITGAGGDVAVGTIKALELSGLDLEFYLMCIDHNSAWLYRYPNRTIAPRAESPNYIDFLVRYILEHQIDVLIPTVDSEIGIVSSVAQLIFEKTGCRVFVNSLDSTKITQDKWATYKFLEKNNFSTPITFLFNDEFKSGQLNFPVIVKPRRGAGSKGIQIINTAGELKNLELSEELIVQEYLEEGYEELTCGVYRSGGGRTIGTAIFKRKLLNGSTQYAERFIDIKIEEQLFLLAELLQTRYLNVQAKFDGKNLFIFELNGRLSGTTAIVAKVFNAPALYIREEILKENVEPSTSNEIFVALRYRDEVFVNKTDFDAMSRQGSTE